MEQLEKNLVQSIGNCIQELMNYSRANTFIFEEDERYAHNLLLDLFKAEPGDLTRQDGHRPLEEILAPLMARGKELGLYADGEEERFETKVLGIITPPPSAVTRRFLFLRRHYGSIAADQYLYDMMVANKYINKEKLSKNCGWQVEGPMGIVQMTINLAKPEKTAAQVLAEKNAPQTNYPKCFLCKENMGFAGTVKHPARQTLRYIPYLLNDEKEMWYMQFSPYQYFHEHCIVFSREHRPMRITGYTFLRLLDFVNIQATYFLGSNADLPIVGGSILSHDHYQGGKKCLPMFFTPARKKFNCGDPDVTVTIRDWYNSVVTISSKKKRKVAIMANKIYQAWQNYDDPSVNIISHTGDTPHNTVTPIARFHKGEFIIDLILRNNRCDEAHPYGIFHPTEDMFHIKQEGIGLIEAMGKFILPGRLHDDLLDVAVMLTWRDIDLEKVSKNEKYGKYFNMLIQLLAEHGFTDDLEESFEWVKDKVAKTCFDILECTAVFKNDDIGRPAFNKFMHSVIDPIAIQNNGGKPIRPVGRPRKQD